jgi:hypothetical protein
MPKSPGATVLGALLMIGCATTQAPVASTYTGPTAVIHETVKQHSNAEADFFGISHIDGNRVENSLTATERTNRGRGMVMSAIGASHRVPTKPIEVRVFGRSRFAAPILDLMNKTYEVSGTVKFEPVANATYTVKGELGPRLSVVWIEDATGAVIGNKIQTSTP